MDMQADTGMSGGADMTVAPGGPDDDGSCDRHGDPSRSKLLILAGCRRYSRMSGQTDAASVAMPARAAETPANAAAHRLFRAAWSSHGLRCPIPSQVIGGAFVVADRNQKNAATNAQIADPI
jgi:hypothetical protein